MRSLSGLQKLKKNATHGRYRRLGIRRNPKPSLLFGATLAPSLTKSKHGTEKSSEPSRTHTGAGVKTTAQMHLMYTLNKCLKRHTHTHNQRLFRPPSLASHSRSSSTSLNYACQIQCVRVCVGVHHGSCSQSYFKVVFLHRS